MTVVAEFPLRGTDAPDHDTADAILALVHQDDQGSAKQWCDRLLTRAADRPRLRASLDAVRAEIALREGDPLLARHHAERALQAIPLSDWGVRAGIPLACLLRAGVELGDAARAEELAARRLPAGSERTRYGVMFRHARGRWHMATGKPAAALADFLACGEIMAELGDDRPSFVPWRSEAALAVARAGDGQRARSLVLEEIALLGERRTRAYGIALAALALTGPLRTRPALLTRAAEIVRDSGDTVELARVLAGLGDTYHRMSDHRRARTLARRAENIAEQCRTAAPRPVNPLSDAERRVAALAGAGHSNREIARRLYITVSTVEQHLTSVYRKLGVRGRTQLPAHL